MALSISSLLVQMTDNVYGECTSAARGKKNGTYNPRRTLEWLNNNNVHTHTHRTQIHVESIALRHPAKIRLMHALKIHNVHCSFVLIVCCGCHLLSDYTAIADELKAMSPAFCICSITIIYIYIRFGIK